MQGLLRKSFMQTGGNFGSPKIDLGGCVLYAPLWRPDMVATCGDISNGTGTIAVSPTILAVGANTITATGAGTFIVRMPEGGTIASGTATITGSPVTINAGVATTITAEGTGNFTCTVSNIIRSKDKNNHSCTVVGATWGSQGRTFDGIDDQISIPDHAVLDFDSTSAFTGELWLKVNVASDACLLNKLNALGNTGYAFAVLSGRPAMYFDGAARNGVVDSIPAGSWYHLVFTWDGSGDDKVRGYINGALSFTSAVISVLTANTDAAVMSGTLGGFARYNGLKGEVRLYNRALSAVEVQRNYLATKWRY